MAPFISNHLSFQERSQQPCFRGYYASKEGSDQTQAMKLRSMVFEYRSTATPFLGVERTLYSSALHLQSIRSCCGIFRLPVHTTGNLIHPFKKHLETMQTHRRSRTVFLGDCCLPTLQTWPRFRSFWSTHPSQTQGCSEPISVFEEKKKIVKKEEEEEQAGLYTCIPCHSCHNMQRSSCILVRKL
jgi:hypothetical protein